MKKYLIIFIIFFSIKNIFPQSNLISFDSKISIESNTLDNNILNTFLYGGTINQELKDHWIGLSRKNNTVNGELSNGISFSKNLQSGNLLFSIFDRNNLNININKDLLKLILNGNYNYQGELLEFNSSNLRITRYQQYKIGYNLKLKKNQIKLAVSYLQGNHNINIVINEGSLFTEP